MDFASVLCVLLSVSLFYQVAGQDAESAGAQTISSFSIKIEPDMQESLVRVGESKLFTCSYSTTDSSQKPVLHWELAEDKITTTSITSRIRIENFGDSLRLRLDNIRYGDEGSYKCVGTLGTQTDSRSIRVEVYNPIVFHSPEEQFGILGETGIVSCNVTGDPAPTINWMFANKSYIVDGEKFMVQGIQMVIKDLQFSDSGYYTCDATVIQRGDVIPYKIKFDVIKVPIIDEDPSIRPENPKIGTKVTVSCSADGVPDPTYQFKKDNNFLPDAQVDKINGLLTIQELTQEDEGDYVCVATNRGGSVEKQFFLDVKVPPTILDMAENIEVEELTQKSLTCLAEGDPTPIVTWQKEGQDNIEDEVVEDGLEILTETRDDEPNKPTGKVMSFASIKVKDAGAYTCTAISEVGSSSKTINLEVKYKPHFDTTFKEKDFYGWEGHTANLTCLASSNDVASIEWFKISSEGVNVPITTDGPYILNPQQKWPTHHLSSSSLMVIVGSDESVYGDYQCEAKNELGTATQTVKLIQAVPPQAPTVSVKHTLSTMVTLEVEVPKETGGQPVTGYYFSFHKLNDSEDNIQKKYAEMTSDVTFVDLRNLEAKTSYVATVQAHNAVGRGTEVTIDFVTKLVSQPLKLNMTSPRQGSEPNSIKVSWSEPDDGGSEIKHFVVKHREVSVVNENAAQWQNDFTKNEEFEVKEVKGRNALGYTISGLKRNTFYEVSISAVNSEGVSIEETRILKTSEESGSQAGKPEVGGNEDEDENEGGNDDAEVNDGSNDNSITDGESKKEEDGKSGSTNRRTSASNDSGSSSVGSASLGSGTVIGVVISLLVLLIVIAIIVFLVIKKKPELVGRLRGHLGGKGGEEERGKGDDGKDPAEEEKLIKKDDTVKVENETEDGKQEQGIEEHHEEFEPDSKPPAQTSPEVGAKNGTVEKPPELSTPPATTEIKITPETPEKPEDPPA